MNTNDSGDEDSAMSSKLQTYVLAHQQTAGSPNDRDKLKTPERTKPDLHNNRWADSIKKNDGYGRLYLSKINEQNSELE